MATGCRSQGGTKMNDQFALPSYNFRIEGYKHNKNT